MYGNATALGARGPEYRSHDGLLSPASGTEICACGQKYGKTSYQSLLTISPCLQRVLRKVVAEEERKSGEENRRKFQTSGS